MQSYRQRLKRAVARLTARNPERLWVHHALAMALFMALLLGTYALNSAAADRTRLAAERIQESNEQLGLISTVATVVSGWSVETDPDAIALHKVINQLEATNRRMTAEMARNNNTGPGLATRDRAARQPIDDFITAARQLPLLNNEEQDIARSQIAGLLRSNELHEIVIGHSQFYAEQISKDAMAFSMLRDLLLAASVVILAFEAAFVFWPAQMTVTATIQKLKRQKNVLTSSQSRLKEANKKLAHIVDHDPLTGLPNRGALIASLEKAIERRETADATLLLVGLDDFKSVNDMIGHDNGDTVLVTVAQALRECVDDEDIVARVGGDEFTVVSSEDDQALLQRIMAIFREPFDINGRRIPIKTSIGFLKIGMTIRNPTDVLSDAEVALQSAKANGGGHWQKFDNSLRDNLSALQRLQIELAEAIKNGEIEPWFQPQIRLADGQLHGAEVLARWRHPQHGLLTPDKFLPAAERAGLIVDLDHAIWRSAMNHAQSWQQSHTWRPSISLNAAPDTISDPNLIERFLLAVSRSGLEIDQIIVEVLETTLITSNDDMAAINIDSLAECGVALELDDFGTGYASLSKLTQLPLAGIKLDRSLISPLPDQAADSVVRAIIALATELGLQVIAEGIEEQTQARHLNKRGCMVGQGYGFGKPMPAKEFSEWLTVNASGPVNMVPQPAPQPKRA